MKNKTVRRSVMRFMLAAGLTLSLTACGDKAADTVTTAEEKQGNGVEYLADQMSQAMDEQAEKRAKEAESARSEGEGDKVVIRSEKDLIKFRDRVNGGEPAVDAELEADLDLSSVCGENIGSWEPIAEFNGTFEGNGHTIANLYCAGSDEDSIGLFASTDEDSVIQNLSVEQASINGGKNAGIIVGYAGGSIINCKSSGTVVSGGRSAGGIAGTATTLTSEKPGLVSDCTNYAEITQTGTVKAIGGGVVGYLYRANAQNCVNEGKVSGSASTIGGAFGAVESGAREKPFVVTDCANHAEVDGEIYVGGFCGDAENCILNRCKNTGAVSGYIYVGGFCGYFGGSQSNSNSQTAMMENCSNEGTVSLKYLEPKQYLKRGSAVYEDQAAAGLAAKMSAALVINCRNGGDLICGTGHDYGNCGAGYLAVGAYPGYRNLLFNCISTGALTPPEDSENFELSRSAVGKYDGENDSALIFYLGEQALEKIAPTEESAFTDGTVLAALNGFPEGVSESLMRRLAKTGFEYELSAWKEGADGFPVLEWE